MRFRSWLAPSRAIETCLLVILAAALLRTWAFIGQGFDVHHDYYGVAPGIFFRDGLRPHLDFYTHYGVFDAALKAGLLSTFAPRLIDLRACLWLLEALALLAVCYGCQLDAVRRRWLLVLICLWLILEPSATGMRASLYWHRLTWSSDVAIVQICLLILLSFWSYRCRLGLEGDDGRAGAPSPLAASPWIGDLLTACRGLLLAGLFFTKFTIGLPMILAVVLADAFAARAFGIPPVTRRRALAALAAGLLLGGGIAFALFGGRAGLPLFIDQVFTGQFQYFSSAEEGSGLLHSLSAILLHEATVLAGLLALALVVPLPATVRLSLVLFAAVLAANVYREPLQQFLDGTLGVPQHVVAYSSLIAAAVLVQAGSLALRGAKQRGLPGRRLPTGRSLYALAVVPIGVASLAQFYPINDPWHTWWAVGTALPAAALLLEERLPARLRDRAAIGWLATAGNAVLLLVTTLVLRADMARNVYLPLAPAGATDDFLAGVTTVDRSLAASVSAVRSLHRQHPRLLVLEAGWGTAFELLGPRAARIVRFRCLREPFNTLPLERYPSMLRCLRQLQAEGWEVVITHNRSLQGLNRSFGKRWTAHWAIVSQGNEPAFVIHSPAGTFSRRSEAGMTYWRLEP